MAIPNYPKPTVRHAWADTPLNPSTDVVDPGDTYVSNGWQQGVKPPRPYFNWLLNYSAAGIRYLCQNGIVAWDGAEVYPSGAVVNFAGILYKSLQANNINQSPSTATTFWGPLNSPTPSAGDSSTNVANTSWVRSNFAALPLSFASLGGQISNAQVPQGAVTQWQSALSIGFAQIFGTIINSQVSQSAVTQWQSVLSIAWSQITGTKNADQLLGFVPNVGAVGSTLALRDTTGILFGSYFNQSSSNNENPTVSQIIVTNGVDNFFRKSSPANLLRFLAGATSFNTTGYTTLPGGIIIQWGTAAFNGSQSSVVASFPTIFPNFCLWASCICAIGGFTPGVQSFNQSSLTMSTNGLGGTAQTFYWISIGY